MTPLGISVLFKGDRNSIVEEVIVYAFKDSKDKGRSVFGAN